ncbi:MAG: choice-of-anchor tandem repeat NxxGxxAF-containing protein [Planctomycetota bacterium]
MERVASAVCSLLIVASEAFPAGPTTVLAIQGEAAPGGALFDSFSLPVVDDNGRVFVQSGLETPGATVSDSLGIFKFEGDAKTAVFRQGDPTFAGDATVHFLDSLTISSRGDVAFIPNLVDAAGTSPDVKAIVTPPDDRVEVFVRARVGDAIRPDEVETISDFTTVRADRYNVFTFIGTTSNGKSGLFDASWSGLTTQLAVTGEPAVGGVGNYTSFNALTVDDSIAFIAGLDRAESNQGVFNGNISSRPGSVAVVGGTAPGEDGATFSRFHEVEVAGTRNRIAFRASLNTPGGNVENNSGIWLTSSPTFYQIARKGDLLEGGPWRLGESEGIALNAGGQVAFFAELHQDTSARTDEPDIRRGLLLGALFKEPFVVAKTGDVAPGSSGVFGAFDSAIASPSLNELGQVAFVARVDDSSGGSADGRGLFLFDPDLGLLRVAGAGDAIGGGSIADLTFEATASKSSDGLGRDGKVAFQFSLDDGRTGIASWEAPDVDTLVPGDATLDGIVDLADFGVLRSNFGQSGYFTTGDFDLDRDVDLDDFSILRSNFGGAASDLAAIDAWAATVPEPGVAAAALFALSCLLRRSRA